MAIDDLEKVYTPEVTGTAEEETIAIYDEIIKQVYDELNRTLRRAFVSLWYNPKGLSPEQVCVTFGTNGGKRFMHFKHMEDLKLKGSGVAVKKNYPPCPVQGKDYVGIKINQDGTIEPKLADTPV